MFNLVCVHPFGKFEKGDIVTDADEIARLMAEDRDHHFVRIAAPEVEETTPAVSAPAGESWAKPAPPISADKT
jgi:hypothetical protein